jgi:hypothetical protein
MTNYKEGLPVGYESMPDAQKIKLLEEEREYLHALLMDRDWDIEELKYKIQLKNGMLGAAKAHIELTDPLVAQFHVLSEKVQGVLMRAEKNIEAFEKKAKSRLGAEMVWTVDGE